MPNSAIRSGSSRYERRPCLKIWMWPGQFIGLMAKMRGALVSLPADCAMKMFSADPPPGAGRPPRRLVEHLRRVALAVAALQAAPHVGDDLLEDRPAVG